jgi:hypothetical protein
MQAEELDAVFRERFHFVTETVELNVATKPQQQMYKYMSTFVEKHDGPHTLLIVYYTGHGVYREDHKYLELTASLNSNIRRGFSQEQNSRNPSGRRCGFRRAHHTGYLLLE